MSSLLENVGSIQIYTLDIFKVMAISKVHCGHASLAVCPSLLCVMQY